jgi:hypothetical protein
MLRTRHPVIYALIDPRTEEVRYVGKSVYGIQRAYAHKEPGCLRRNLNPHKCNWIRQLNSLGLQFKVCILQEVEDEVLLGDVERNWISKLRTEGVRLLNVTDGGEGTLGRKLSAKSIAKLSKSKSGVPFSEEHVRALSKSHGGREFVDQLGRGYHSIKGAARQLGLHASEICRVLKGKRRMTGGLVFTYV